MHAVIRMYSGTGAKQLVELLETRKAEVEAIMSRKGIRELLLYPHSRWRCDGDRV
jgi:hypothetical protein